MEKPFTLVDRWSGYVTKPDKTNTDAKYLVNGSQNVLINDGEKIEAAKGYTLDGAAGTSDTGVIDGFQWDTNRAQRIIVRALADKIQVRYGDTPTWETVVDDTIADIEFATWWDNTEKIDKLIWVLGDDYIYRWSGAMGTLASVAAGTITINEQVGALGFTTSGTRSIRIKDSGGTWRTTAYTAQSGADFTVSTDLTGYTFDADAPVFQVIESAVVTGSTWSADSVRVMENQVFVGSRASRVIYVSSNSDITDFTFSSPRAPGEGALLTLDNNFVAFAPQDMVMAISAGYDDWYRTEFHQEAVGAAITETMRVKKVKTGPGMGAKSQKLTCNVGNAIAYLDNNNVMRLMGDISDLESFQLTAISDPIKADFDGEDFTGGTMTAISNRIYVTSPVNTRVYINQLNEDENGNKRRLWQPPLLFPYKRPYVIDLELYAHSTTNDESYKIFDGYNANGNSYKCKAVTSYRTFGKRAHLKNFNEWYIEGYITANTTITASLNYDFGGTTRAISETISGTDADLIFESIPDYALGDDSLGDVSLSGDVVTETITPKFRVYFEEVGGDFFEIQEIFETDDVDQQWQILSTGFNVSLSENEAVQFKR